jgi:nucleotide-binding universal stress UspA family protein
MVGQKILVALDRSINAQFVFEAAIDLAHLKNSQLLLVFIVDWEADDSQDFIGTIGDRTATGENLGIRKEYLAHKLEEAERYIQNFAIEAREKGILTEIEIEVGDPSQQICQIAADRSMDLIIIGSRGYRGVTEVLLGSVSNYVSHHAPCSVLIARSSSI